MHIHVLHVRELFYGAKDQQFLLMPSWVPTYELDPLGGSEKVVDRSEEMCDSLLMHRYFRPELTDDELKYR